MKPMLAVSAVVLATCTLSPVTVTAHVPAEITGTALIHVRAGSASGDGRSWATAFGKLQDAIDAAWKLGGGHVWVAEGTYYPTGDGNRDATFQLRPGVALYGGFAGGEERLDQRDWRKHVATLSGNLGRKGVHRDNSYHVVTGADNALLDGFTIADGYGLDAAGGPPPGQGADASVRAKQSSPSQGPPGGAIHTSPSAILSGASRGLGAGMLNFQAAPTVRNCIFRNNQAGKGGAVYNMITRSFPPRRDASVPAPLFIDCQFLDNHARGRGGAVANDLGTNPTFRGCTWLRNSCDQKGGAVYNDFGCSPTLVNCLFAENRAASAAAMGNDGASSPLIVHCTFSRNVALEEGAALYQGSGPANNPFVVGCILWDDHCENGPAEIFNWHDNSPTVSGCCVQGGCAGKDNFDIDPQFVDPDHGDYRPRPGSLGEGRGYTAATGDDLPAAAQSAAFQPSPYAAPYRAPLFRGPARIVCVRAANTAGPFDGNTWATAFASLQDALAVAPGRRLEIWVAEGAYRPSENHDRAASFVLREGVELYGGFAGTETARVQRDWKLRATILSGRLGEPGYCAGNSFHVVTGASGAVLDGFTIRDGNADSATYDGHGGGMINYRRAPQSGPMGLATGYSPVVRNCTFTQNHAREGGAVYDYDRGAPQFIDCRFVENGALYGGAIVDRVGVRSTITNCEFVGNNAVWRAGAVYLDYGARPVITDCRFQGNRSQCHGGAIATISRASQLENTIAVLVRCSFIENTAGHRGGAIANNDQSVLGLDGCTFTANTAASGGALANNYRAQAVLLDCHFSKNTAAKEKETDTATDDTSRVSRARADWPSQTVAPSPALPRGFGPPGR